METVIKEDELDLVEELEDDGVAISYDIATYPSDYTLSGLYQMWKDGDIVIPDFQREFVWTIKQSSLLIDSFLSGLPVPPVFFYVDDENVNLVIDGQQRIMSVVFFLDGYFGKESTQGRRQVFRLANLGESRFDKKKYDELKESDRRKLKQSVLRAVNIRQLSPVGEKTSAYHIFERLNTGGTPLRPQEIRNVVFRGDFNKSLKKANEDANWRLIVGKSYIDKHQKDIELLLRVFSLITIPYEKPMKEHLNRAMAIHQHGRKKEAKRFHRLLPQLTSTIISELGEKPFHLRGPLNVSALDSVMSVLFQEFERLDLGTLKSRYEQLMKDTEFIETTSINTTDGKTVLERLKIVRRYLVEN